MARKGVGDFPEEDKKRRLNKDSFQKLLGIFKYMLPYKGKFFLGMLLLVIGGTTILLFPFLTGKLVNAAVGKVDWITTDILEITMMLVVVLVVQGVVAFFRVYLFAQVSEKGIADVRQGLYTQLISLPMAFYDKRRTGELLSRITSDVSFLQDTFSVTLAQFVRQLITLIGALGFIFISTPKLSLFMIATFPVVIVVAMVFGKFIRKLSKKTQDKLAEANVIVEETLQSIPVVKAFTSELKETARYRKSLDGVVDMALKAATYRGLFVSFIIIALFGGIVAVLWKGATLVQEGNMEVGDLLSFVLFTTFIGGAIANLGSVYGQIQRSIGASERVLELLNEETEVELSRAETEKLDLKGQVTFENVGFSYPTRTEMKVLENINFEINVGEKIALVGHSGAGKSTIVQLLMRFYKIGSGMIKVDGKDIEDYDLRAFRENIGIVPQEVILFGGTIRENIAYGNPSATEQEVKEAAEKANAMEFISAFPEGLETIVGERGMTLSGGQKQRIAIARAILKDPTILILDEATSSLDAESEALVQNALDLLMENRTTIIIAHRLATIRKVDKIHVISKGKIVESGSHQDLLKNTKGIYNKLVKLQFQEA